jgi:predicted transcriptional regulator
MNMRAYTVGDQESLDRLDLEDCRKLRSLNRYLTRRYGTSPKQSRGE